jgi:hypothetical protein
VPEINRKREREAAMSKRKNRETAAERERARRRDTATASAAAAGQRTFSSMTAEHGRQLKQSVNAFQSLMLYLCDITVR